MMAEVTVASHKWRIPTDEFSPLCDNQLPINNSIGMAGNPSKMNQAGICFPACKMCVSPYGSLVDISDACSAFPWMKKSADDVVQIPSQWTVTCDGGSFTLARAVGTAAAGLSTNAFLPELSGRTFLMRGGLINGNGLWESDYLSLGDRLNYYELTRFETGAVVKKYRVVFGVEVKIGYFVGRTPTNCVRGPIFTFRRTVRSTEMIGLTLLDPQYFTCASTDPVIGKLVPFSNEQPQVLSNLGGHGSNVLNLVEKTTVDSSPLFTEMNNDANQHSEWKYRFGVHLNYQFLTYAHNLTIVAQVNNANSCVGVRTTVTSPHAGFNIPVSQWTPAAIVFSTVKRDIQ
jgi:hypothetical protein